MKIFAIILLILGILFTVSQVWANSQVEDIEEYPYEVVKKYEDFEIRSYARAHFIYATMNRSGYEESSSKGFNILAGYIFGGNEEGKKIAMTSPVVMEMNDSITMKFLVPAQYDLDELPRPKDIQVQFKTEEQRTLAAITFDGFANDEKIEEYKDKLFKALDQEGIEHEMDFSFLGYDPPFKLFARKNEIVVEVK